MITYSENICNKTFVGDSMKDAYLKACKWLSTYIIANPELNNCLSYKFEKKSTTTLPTIELILFYSINKDVLSSRHCAICKEVSQSFLMNSEADCNNCKYQAFDKRAKQTFKDSSLHTKNKLKEVMRG